MPRVHTPRVQNPDPQAGRPPTRWPSKVKQVKGKAADRHAPTHPHAPSCPLCKAQPAMLEILWRGKVVKPLLRCSDKLPPCPEQVPPKGWAVASEKGMQPLMVCRPAGAQWSGPSATICACRKKSHLWRRWGGWAGRAPGGPSRRWGPCLGHRPRGECRRFCAGSSGTRLLQ